MRTCDLSVVVTSGVGSVWFMWASSVGEEFGPRCCVRQGFDGLRSGVTLTQFVLIKNTAFPKGGAVQSMVVINSLIHAVLATAHCAFSDD